MQAGQEIGPRAAGGATAHAAGMQDQAFVLAAAVAHEFVPARGEVGDAILGRGAYEVVEAAAQNLRAGRAQQHATGGVGLDEAAGVVHDEHRVERALENRQAPVAQMRTRRPAGIRGGRGGIVKHGA